MGRRTKWDDEKHELYYVGWMTMIIVVAGVVFNLWRVMV